MANVDIAALSEAVKQVESGGRRYDSSGKLLTSGKGAQGEMQVMPATARDPGFGVIPAQSDSPDELARVGRDYLSALVDKYGNVEHALVAYNWGPTNANKWIARGANKAKLPRETRNYLSRVDKLMGAPVEVAAQVDAPPVKAAREPRPTEQAVEGDGFRGYSNSVIGALGPGFQAALAAVSLSDDEQEGDEDQGTSIAEAGGKSAMARALLQDLSYQSPFSALEPSKQPIVQRMAEGGEAESEGPSTPGLIGTASELADKMGIITPSNQTVADVLNIMVPGASLFVTQPSLGNKTFAKYTLDYLAEAKGKDEAKAPVVDMSSKSNSPVNVPVYDKFNLVSSAAPGKAPVYAPSAKAVPVAVPNISQSADLGGLDAPSIGNTGVSVDAPSVSAGNEGAGLAAADSASSGGGFDFGGGWGGIDGGGGYWADGGEVSSPEAMRKNEERALRLLQASESPVTAFLPFSSGATEFLGGRLADEAIGDIEAEYQRLKKQAQQRKEEVLRESTNASKLREALYGRKGQEMDPYEAEERAYRSTVENTIGFPVPDERREARRLLDYLKSIDFMPTVRESDRGPGGRGHEGPAYRFKNNKTPGTINFPVDSPDAYRSYTHELSHAADRPSRQAYNALVNSIKFGDRDLTEQELRFVSNFRKLYATPTELPLQFREGELLENKHYRSGNEEMRAFGTGNMAQRMPKEGFSRVDIGSEFNPHVDPTMATEAAIMREMYRDLYKSQGKVGYAEGGEVADPEEALFAGREDVPAKPRISNEEFIRESLKGLGEYPYLAAGAPVDLATMAMRPFGYDVQKPVMGSEWIKQKATEMGVRPEDTTDPRLQGPRVASEMLFSMMNPASAPRAGAKAVDIATDPKTQQAAKALMKDYMAAKEAQYYALPGASYAAKPKGGVWLPAGSGAKPSQGSPEYIRNNYVEELARKKEVIDPEKYAAIEGMLRSGKVEKYFKNKYATGDDPVRNAMVEDQIPFETLNREPGMGAKAWQAQLDLLDRGTYHLTAEAARRQLEFLYDRNARILPMTVYNPMSPTFEADSALLSMGQKMSLEGVPKNLQNPPVIAEIQTDVPGSYFPEEPPAILRRTLENNPPSAVATAVKKGEPIYSFSDQVSGFSNIKAFDSNEVIPALATLTPKQLSKMSFEEALIAGLKNTKADPLRDYQKDVDRLVRAINRNDVGSFKPRSVKNAEELYKFGTKPVKLLDGRQTHTLDTEWVQLTDPRAAYLEGEVMSHSVGGYWLQERGYGRIGAGGREAFEKGDAVIYSLRDKNTGEPRGVTIEVDTTDPETIFVNQIKGKSNKSPISKDQDIFELLYALEKKYKEERPNHEFRVGSQSYESGGIKWDDAYNTWLWSLKGDKKPEWKRDESGNLEYLLDFD